MTWIVIGEQNGKILLTSKSNINAILPKGSYLTVEEGNKKFILRVDKSGQTEPYSPSPMIIDMDLSSIIQDQVCKNIIEAFRVRDLSERNDGLVDFIKPQSLARRSTQEEIDKALEITTPGPEVFLATVHSNENRILADEQGDYIKVKLPTDMFFHQTLICGKTGTGKTVALKHLAQYFVEKMGGAVLAVNVKDNDLLRMDVASKTSNQNITKEWASLGESAHGVKNFVVYYPANVELSPTKEVSKGISKKITLKVEDVEPESLAGLLRGISDAAAQNLPNVFRFWLKKKKKNGEKFKDFTEYFASAEEDPTFSTLNERDEVSMVRLHKGSFNNIMRQLDVARSFFDNESAVALNEEDILSAGKMSVIDLAVERGIEFGSILLRHLLYKIRKAKSDKTSEIPILIIIDEVHKFYDTESSQEALGDLDTICRTGRSQEMGVIFASQSPSDIPSNLSNVINTKIFFKSDPFSAKSFGILVSTDEMEGLKKGYACVSIYGIPQIKIIKFPLSLSGVFEKNGRDRR